MAFFKSYSCHNYMLNICQFYSWNHDARPANHEGSNHKEHVLVVFHVIIPRLIWEWDVNSRMTLRLFPKNNARSQDVVYFESRCVYGSSNSIVCTLYISILMLQRYLLNRVTCS